MRHMLHDEKFNMQILKSSMGFDAMNSDALLTIQESVSHAPPTVGRSYLPWASRRNSITSPNLQLCQLPAPHHIAP